MLHCASGKALVTFHDVAACFSEDGWKLLGEWQKELYKNVIKEIHHFLISLGCTIVNPDTLLRIQEGGKVRFPDQRLSVDIYNPSTLPSHPAVHPDLLLRIKQEDESCCRDQHGSEETDISKSPGTGPPTEACLVPFRIKDEEGPCPMDHQPSERSNCSTHPSLPSYPAVHPDLLLRIKQEDESCCKDEHGSEERDISKILGTGPPAEACLVPFRIKEEEEPCPMDHQPFERRDCSTHPSRDPVVPAVFLLNPKQEERMDLLEEQESEERTGDPVVTSVLSLIIKQEEEIHLPEEFQPEGHTTAAEGMLSRHREDGDSAAYPPGTPLDASLWTVQAKALLGLPNPNQPHSSCREISASDGCEHERTLFDEEPEGAPEVSPSTFTFDIENLCDSDPSVCDRSDTEYVPADEARRDSTDVSEESEFKNTIQASKPIFLKPRNDQARYSLKHASELKQAKRSLESAANEDHVLMEDADMGAETSHVLVGNVQKNESGNLVCNKKQFCYYCKKPKVKIVRHLRSQHLKEKEVVEAMTAKSPGERRKMFAVLRNHGNYLHNQEVKKNGKGTMVAFRRPSYREDPNNYLHCAYCKICVRRTQLWKHMKTCTFAPKREGDMTKPCPVQSVTAFYEVKCPDASKGLWGLINRIRNPESIKIIASDPTIIDYGHYLFSKFQHDIVRKEYIHCKLRDLGRLLHQLRLDKRVQSLEDAVKFDNLDDVLSAVKVVAGLDAATGKLRKPWLALTLGYSLKRIAWLTQCKAQMKGHQSLATEAGSFIQLYDQRWEEMMSSAAVSKLKQAKLEEVTASEDEMPEPVPTQQKANRRKAVSSDEEEVEPEFPRRQLRKPENKKRKKQKWSTEEVKAVEKHLLCFIHKEKVPGKSACEKCQQTESALKNREWRDVKYYVKNRITARRRKLRLRRREVDFDGICC